ncbi:MAG: CoB--CoM heterodisulfide reductase iron-sulfur subunit B family protein [Pseudomonadota bacterium]
MKYALFLGCTIPARARNYELSARRVAERLGIEFVDVEEFVCCGFPIKAIDQRASEVLGGYNLTLAQQKGLDICTLCSSCTSALTETARHLAGNGPVREEVNQSLSGIGLNYDVGVKVRHMARILYEDIGPEEIRNHLQKDLSGLRIAVHYGCHYLKPSEIYDKFDSVEDPSSIDRLVSITGAKVVAYPGKKRCCGGPVLPVDEKVALSVTKEKLDAISKAGADALCLVCPFCAVMYDGNQKSIESEYGANYNLPVLYLTQILGLAMGFDSKALGLNMNVVKTKELLKSYSE